MRNSTVTTIDGSRSRFHSSEFSSDFASPDAAEDAVGGAGDVVAVFVAAGFDELVFLEGDEEDE